jgi:SAM-dependent methyltransferase
MKTHPLYDLGAFRRANLLNWERNTEFWLAAKLRHVPHVLPVTAAILTREAQRVGGVLTVVDVGCGDAWVLRLLKERGFNYRYIGLDFNASMIDHLRIQHPEVTASFRLVDIERGLPDDLRRAADVVVNAFSFFEITNLPTAFANTANLVNAEGGLFVAHIDPLSQLLCLVDDLNELRTELAAFEQHGSRLAYDKNIDLQDEEAQRVYKGILYRISEYHKLARVHDLQLEDFEEILHARDGRPQWYQIAFWRRGGYSSKF